MEVTTEDGDSNRNDTTTRRPMNAFLIFCKDQRKTVQEQNSHLDNRSVTKMLGEIWASMSADAKSSYMEMAKKSRDAFIKENPGFKWFSSDKNKKGSRGGNANRKGDAKITVGKPSLDMQKGPLLNVPSHGHSATQLIHQMTAAPYMNQQLQTQLALGQHAVQSTSVAMVTHHEATVSKIPVSLPQPAPARVISDSSSTLLQLARMCSSELHAEAVTTSSTSLTGTNQVNASSADTVARSLAQVPPVMLPSTHVLQNMPQLAANAPRPPVPKSAVHQIPIGVATKQQSQQPKPWSKEWQPNRVSLPEPRVQGALPANPLAYNTPLPIASSECDDKPMDLSAHRCTSEEAVSKMTPTDITAAPSDSSLIISRPETLLSRDQYPACGKLVEKVIESLYTHECISSSADLNQNSITSAKTVAHSLPSHVPSAPSVNTKTVPSILPPPPTTSHSLAYNKPPSIGPNMTFGQIQETLIRQAVQDDIYDFSSNETRLPPASRNQECVTGSKTPWNSNSHISKTIAHMNILSHAGLSTKPSAVLTTGERSNKSLPAELLSDASKVTALSVTSVASVPSPTSRPNAADQTKPLKKRSVLCDSDSDEYPESSSSDSRTTHKDVHSESSNDDDTTRKSSRSNRGQRYNALVKQGVLQSRRSSSDELSKKRKTVEPEVKAEDKQPAKKIRRNETIVEIRRVQEPICENGTSTDEHILLKGKTADLNVVELQMILFKCNKQPLIHDGSSLTGSAKRKARRCAITRFLPDPNPRRHTEKSRDHLMNVMSPLFTLTTHERYKDIPADKQASQKSHKDQQSVSCC